jgi:hypothetical protein
MKKLLVIALLSGFAALLDPSPASACSCSGFTPFDETARQASIVVTGRVTAVGELKYDDDPESIDLDVEWVGKGGLTASSIRVWNGLAGTSCGGEFKPLKVGTIVALALAAVERPASELVGDPEIDEALVHPAVGDFEVITGCGEGTRLFRTKRDRDRWIAQALK